MTFCFGRRTLIYSKIEVIPDWAKKLTVLEYLYVVNACLRAHFT